MGWSVGFLISLAALPFFARADDVIVRFQGSQEGVLQVAGVAGPGQSSTVFYSLCGMSSRGSLECATPSKAVLNAEISLPPGTYHVQYSNTDTFVEIRANEQTVLRLRKILFPNSPQPIGTTVFWDLTNHLMQDRFLEIESAESRGSEAHFHFEADGSVSGGTGPTRKWVANSGTGSFVSVIPGVYMVEFADPATGARKTLFGLR